MAPSPLSPIFAHAMWRSGSTYLASRFAASDRYLLYYEPCHEGVGRKPSRARTRDRSQDRQLRHPEIEGGYFATYEMAEPRSGQSLTAHFAPDISLRNVYGDASGKAIHYLDALISAASAQDKIAFLGFCRAGTQMPQAQQRLAGRGLHLWRAPREQFASYGWPKNDYFMPGTILQLAHSPRYRALARTLAPEILNSVWIGLALRLPDQRARWQYRLACRAAAQLNATQSYALFFLSWLISYDAGSAASEFSFSLSSLMQDATLRHTVEQAFEIDFRDLRATPVGALPDLAYEAIETDVIASLSALIGRPIRLPE